jgi:DNA-binding transcriptional regulator YiaG
VSRRQTGEGTRQAGSAHAPALEREAPQIARQTRASSLAPNLARASTRALREAPRAQGSTTVQAPAPDDPTKGLIGRKIVEGREHAGLSQGQLARRLDVDRRQLSEWERGVWEPNLRNLRRIAIALSLPLEFFLDENYPVA